MPPSFQLKPANNRKISIMYFMGVSKLYFKLKGDIVH